MDSKPSANNWRRKAHEVIFEADTFAGKLFDIVLIIAICLSVTVTMLTSVKSINAEYGLLLKVLEWIFTILFTVEYTMRIICLTKPLKYALSPLGIIDVMSFIPTYLELFLSGSKYLTIIRVLRVLRIFRILKLGQYTGQMEMLRRSLYQSRRKISVFIVAVSTLVMTLGSIMYLIEGAENGFTSIPKSIYWAVVTLTTVGYGDVSPQTPLGQFISSIVMLLGYAIIAVPTGIVSVEMSKSLEQLNNTQSCPSCGSEKHDTDADYCKYCGSKLNS